MPLTLRFTKPRMNPARSLFQSLDEMLAELEAYLLSPELYWPLGSRSHVIHRLTLGNLLLTFDQLYAQRDSFDLPDETQFRTLEIAWETAEVKWRSAVSKKGSLEIGSRLNLWKAYLMDLGEGQGASFDYRQEVRNRVIIERLFDLGLNREAWGTDLQSVDRTLRSLVVPHNFIWAKELEPHYPRDVYWYLYRTPRKQD